MTKKFYPAYQRPKDRHFDSPYERIKPQRRKRIAWLSQFPPTLRQIETLQRFCGTEVQIDHCTIRNAQQIAEYVARTRPDDAVAVMPTAALIPLLAEFRARGLQLPLWSDAEPCEPNHPECDIRTPDGRTFRSTSFDSHALLSHRSFKYFAKYCNGVCLQYDRR